MEMMNFKSFLPFLFILVFVIDIRFVACQTFNLNSCTGANSSSSSDRSNIQSLLSFLSSNASVSGVSFYNTSFNGIYGLYLCRGDVNSSMCQACVQSASQSLPQLCPSSVGAVVWYDECLLRYSNTSFFGRASLDPGFLMWNTQNDNSTSPGEQDFGVRGMIFTLVDQAVKSATLFSTKVENVAGDGSKMRYALAECSKDLNSSQCNTCLGTIANDIQNCCAGRAGWRYLYPSCFVRYEQYLFFEETAASEPVPAAPGPVTDTGKSTSKVVIIVVSTLAAAFILVIAGIFYCCRKKRRQGEERSEEILLRNPKSWRKSHMMESGMNDSDEDQSGEMHHFDLSEILAATNNFSDANKLGEGGFGPVYKGKMLNGKEVAVKRLSMRSSQGLQEFKNEVKLIIKLQHKNLVRLLGYCLEEDEKLLVYEFMANTSLDAFLFNSEKCKLLDWETRANIIIGTAKGMQYLHEDSRLKIIHRDLKVSNILLDEDMTPKISDFGTARIFGGKQMEANTERVVGTYGYMAPEYALEGLFSVKSDVYSYGMLMLEIISGKKNRGFYHPDCGQSLLTYAWMMYNEGKALELIDSNIVNDCPLHEVLRWVQIALLCVQDDPALRPTMSEAVLMLGSKSGNLPTPSAPPYSAAKFAAILSDYSTTNERMTRSTTSERSSTNTSQLN